ncbi:MAG: hypothetical protein JXB49_27690 [Bacteroidales bacterium]|nr:hypothetical protein [Bacteroidales bacterium]MBN2818367.1 hypothetical protein [Bacteroidales bacterium]
MKLTNILPLLIIALISILLYDKKDDEFLLTNNYLPLEIGNYRQLDY